MASSGSGDPGAPRQLRQLVSIPGQREVLVRALGRAITLPKRALDKTPSSMAREAGEPRRHRSEGGLGGRRLALLGGADDGTAAAILSALLCTIPKSDATSALLGKCMWYCHAIAC